MSSSFVSASLSFHSTLYLFTLTLTLYSFTILRSTTRTMSSTIQNITSAIPSLGRARLLISSADDVVIVSAVRTPITRVSQRSHPSSPLAILKHSTPYALHIWACHRIRDTPTSLSTSSAALTPNRPRKEGLKIAYPKTYSPQYSKRPSSGQKSTPQRSGMFFHLPPTPFHPPFLRPLFREGKGDEAMKLDDQC